MRRGAVLLGALAVLFLSSCAPAVTEPSQQPPVITSVTASASDVITIRTAGYPEGPVAEWNRTDPGAEVVFELLPAVLPDQMPQPEGCDLGNVTTLVLSDGGSIDYGPCVRPATIDAIRCASFGLPEGC